MNLYNIIISSALTSFILLLIESIICFTLLTSIFNNIFNNIIKIISSIISFFINNNYYTLVEIIKYFAGIDITKETLNFQTLAIKIYSVGTMHDGIMKERKEINQNNILSYIIYSVIAVGFLILIGIIIFINKTNQNVINISSVFYNVIISLVLFTIFIVSASFVVFINIQDNVNFNFIKTKFIKLLQNLLNN